MQFWIAIGVMVALVIYQQFRIYRIHRNAQNQEELFQIASENVADMIALVDVKGRRLYNSPAYKRILGYSAAELGETSSFEQIHSDDRFQVLYAAREARETGVGKRLEYRIKHKDGSLCVLESVANAVRDDAAVRRRAPGQRHSGCAVGKQPSILRGCSWKGPRAWPRRIPGSPSRCSPT